MTIARDDLARFSNAFDQAVRDTLKPEDLEAAITTDGPLAPEELNLDTAYLLKRAGPWGQHFPEPVFDGEFRVVSQRIVGENHLKLVLQPVEGGGIIDGIASTPGRKCRTLPGVGRGWFTNRMPIRSGGGPICSFWWIIWSR